jgi:hypothetical protein
VFDEAMERCDPPVVEEAVLLMSPQASARGRPETMIRRTVGLEGIESDLGRRVHIATRFSEQVRRNMHAVLTLCRGRARGLSERQPMSSVRQPVS